MSDLAGCHTYQDTNFQSGDSPAVLEPIKEIGTPASGGFIKNTGSGNINIKLECKRSEIDSNDFLLKDAEEFNLKGLDVTKITLTHVTDSSYKIFIHR